ncbi:hypothetical protein PG997_010969 [Apiospora hydei]|uniref:Uncharacterized protein n=1 Tax=Apiospora hydei TaxID=1337664 RepID=A0ABR1VHQ0_9PEZI
MSLNYHWGFLIVPRQEKAKAVPGTHCHVKNSPRGWVYEKRAFTNTRSTASLLVRVVIAKITDKKRLLQILRQIPGLEAIKQDGKCVGTTILDWSTIEPMVREYAAAKTTNRRFTTGNMFTPKPTFNILERRETNP